MSALEILLSLALIVAALVALARRASASYWHGKFEALTDTHDELISSMSEENYYLRQLINRSSVPPVSGAKEPAP